MCNCKNEVNQVCDECQGTGGKDTASQSELIEPLGTLFLLWDGQSPDGRGDGKYIGRTTDKRKAVAHLKRVNGSPYNCGKVVICTGTEFITANISDDIWST